MVKQADVVSPPPRERRSKDRRDEGERHNEGKLPIHLASTYAYEGMLKVLHVAAQGEYSEWNWAKGLDIAECIDSLERHIMALKRGEFIDPKSGLPHVDHMQCNTMFLSHFHHREMWPILDLHMEYRVLRQTEEAFFNGDNPNDRTTTD